jgi:endogenous inhibitor of DNA gyrase (YacG/DUF329 family)
MEADPEMSAASDGKRHGEAAGPRCPACRRAAEWAGNPNRPFCSLTCRLIDLGVWLDERYRIESEGPDDVS